VVRVSAAAAVLAIASANREEAAVLATIPSGWRNVRSQRNQIALVTDDGPIEASYVVGKGTPSVEVQNQAVDIAAVYAVEPDLVDMAVGGIRMVFRVHRVGAEIYVDSVLGSEHFTVPPRFPVAQAAAAVGSMVAATPGRVVAVLVAPGDVVTSGDVLMVVESMKMEQATVATVSGRITAVAFGVGDQVGAHDVLVTIEEPDRSDD
jgi:propionyl-CoA carboxylase alpha chain